MGTNKTSTLDVSASGVLDSLRLRAPNISYKSGTTFSWSPSEKTVYYKANALLDDVGTWAIIHETAHALLDHCHYNNDFDLLKIEVAAWKKAQEIASQLNITIQTDHIEDCLDTYRDWLHRRSTCPTCGTVSLQRDPHLYQCHNCHSSWAVSAERFCRPYRQTKKLLTV